VFNPSLFNPCARNVRRANNERAHDDVTESMCGDIEKLFVIVTARILTEVVAATHNVRERQRGFQTRSTLPGSFEYNFDSLFRIEAYIVLFRPLLYVIQLLNSRARSLCRYDQYHIICVLTQFIVRVQWMTVGCCDYIGSRTDG